MRKTGLQHPIRLLIGLSLILFSTASIEAGIGRLWPFASKKQIKRQVDPINGQLTELEEIGKKHEAQIKEVDERAQAGLKKLMTQNQEVDLKIQAADQKSENAIDVATQAKAHLNEVETNFENRIGNVDSYHLSRKITLNFRFNQFTLDKKSRETLDDIAAELKDSKGYLLEIAGYADPSGPTEFNLELSRERAQSVVRYMTESHDFPLFRMRTVGMGVIPKDLAEGGPQSSRRVEIRLLRNDSLEVASK
jgi:outer membrane protein OmpA-like peptidoglycan-associated protein